jgi:tetratricopeptide (TPR) repeat protein/thioredoxin-like negative regulator of GroEL
MQRLVIGVLPAVILVAAVSRAVAQADAQAAYQQAKTAYQAGQFPQARDAAKRAAETDPKNAEVFLLLGKAQYQLGELDEALAAWKQTLTLAPQEPFAAKMLEVLQARRADVQTRIRLVEAMIDERLFAAAAEQCRALLADKATSEAQRAAVLTLQAEVLVRTSHSADAQKVLREVLVLYPKQADEVQTTLLMGQAKLHGNCTTVAEGLALLKKVIAEHAGTPAAATAQLELLSFDLDQGPSEPRIAALAKWLAANGKHRWVDWARRRLIEAHFGLTMLGPPPRSDSPLGPADIAALAVAREVIAVSVRGAEVAELVERCLKHFQEHYAMRLAFAAAADGVERLLAAPRAPGETWPRGPRVALLRALAGYRQTIALDKLAKEAKAGQLSVADPAVLPKELAAAVAAYDALRQEDAAAPPWPEVVRLAAEVRALAAQVPWPDRVTALRAPDAWAMAIALPVLKADPGPEAVKAAVEVFQGAAREYQAVGQPGAWPLALAIERQLLAALPAASTAWPEAALCHAMILDACAKNVFAENVKAGRAAENAKLSDAQKELIGTLAKLVAQDAGRAPAVLNQLAGHLRPWIEAGHWAVAEVAYAALRDALPPASRHEAELAIVQLWIDQVFQRDQRLGRAGLTVARQLDPTLKKALLRCYELEAGLEPDSPKLARVRGLWDAIVTHYKLLEYEDVAEAAIRTKPEKAVEAADQYAEFQGIRLREEQARRGLERLLRQYGAAEKLGLTPELEAVVAAWTKFIAAKGDSPIFADHRFASVPAKIGTVPLARQAAERVLDLGRLYERHGAPQVAAGVYSRFAEFAAGVEVLAQSAPGQPGIAHRTGYMAAAALESHAAKVLAKAMADRKPDEPPPAKLSAEFAAAIAAYKAFLLPAAAAAPDAKPQAAGEGAKPQAAGVGVKPEAAGPAAKDAVTYQAFLQKNPQNTLAGDAIRRIMAVAVEYAQLDAWDVAEGVYADLEQSKLAIRRPERLEFARGVCQMGRAMPAHAREILVALGSAGLGVVEQETESLALRNGPQGATSSSEVTVNVGSPFDLGGGSGPGPGHAPSGGPSPGPGPGPGPGPSWATAGGAAAPSGPMSAPRPNAPAEMDSGRFRTEWRQGDRIEFGYGPQTQQAKDDANLLAMIQRQESSRSARVAQLRDQARYVAVQPGGQQQAGQQDLQQMVRPVQQPPAPPLSEAELARLQKAIDAAYTIFQDIRKRDADTPTAVQARGEILVMVNYWRGVAEWQRSSGLADRFLADNPLDPQLPQLRLEAARDGLAWAAKPIARTLVRQEMLAEVAGRFAAARAELAKIVADFPHERALQQEAQWEAANSYLSEARTISAVSPTLARGQFVRAARELRAVALRHPTHPQIGSIAGVLWGISQEMEGQGYDEEAVLVWNELAIFNPLDPLAQQAIEKIAQTYRRDLKRPLRAAETYLELNFIRGGADPGSQEAVFQIGSALRAEKRWVEALHVLETFVDSFPRHAQAGQALAMIGQIHQANEAWQDAINAYRRVIDEYKDGQWVQDAKWAIAECTINLSRWREAVAAYRDYAAAFPQDKKVAEGNRRIEILKDLARYQELVDEKGQRKAFDAQFQIATILRTQLANPVKAIIEYRKVVTNWPESYVAAGALYEIGTAYLGLGETAKAREALQAVAKSYATSPLAGAALFMVGKSYEDEADRLATATREKTVELSKERAQKKAYEQVQSMRRGQELARNERVLSLKSAGKSQAAELEEAIGAVSQQSYNYSNAVVFAQQAQAEVETLTAAQLADRQDKINAALRKAIEAYGAASKIAGGNKADAALLQMANIYDQRLKDSKAAMQTWSEIIRQFSGTAVAEDASWKLAQYYEREGKYAQAIEAYNAFLRNYRRSPNAGPAQFAVAECYEHLGQWVAAMDSYNNYLNNFADGPLAAKAKEQINWIKTYRL